MTFPTNLPDSVTMNLDTITASDIYLTFDYSVHNYSPYQIFLVTNLFHHESSGGIRIDPDLVYVSKPPDAPLSLCKQFLPATDGSAIVGSEIPLASNLGPGWMMTETVRLPLPIQVNYPYPDTSDVGKVPTDQFTFTIGYVLAEEDSGTQETVTIGDSVYTRLDSHYLLNHQRLKKSPPVRANLTH